MPPGVVAHRANGVGIQVPGAGLDPVKAGVLKLPAQGHGLPPGAILSGGGAHIYPAVKQAGDHRQQAEQQGERPLSQTGIPAQPQQQPIGQRRSREKDQQPGKGFRVSPQGRDIGVQLLHAAGQEKHTSCRHQRQSAPPRGSGGRSGFSRRRNLPALQDAPCQQQAHQGGDIAVPGGKRLIAAPVPQLVDRV